ncbi:HNH endonuclease [Streptomyces lunaelactis]|uniref:HNH endonuclease n=1 Tax=Streptomyces lunaelactis TaxID=1535768 RepID=A0A2R4T1F4_9ACTN|nr:HNH endonuclease signature motif containing protein [Streptomyces lunaelactis]AVZ72963.1 HNH endonuclease [Streptomyces lunaelactis]NUK87139.1 HNH endonuclease [Streptomyces lunaelactis]
MKAIPITAPITEADTRRFWVKVALPNENGCLLWTAGKTSRGYGAFDHCGRKVVAHRFAYAALVGPVPEGLELDHLCRDRACVTPDHLEPVTHVENVRRGDAGTNQAVKTHCPQGHEYDDANTYAAPGNRRRCRGCHREHMRARRATQRTQGGAA